MFITSIRAVPRDEDGASAVEYGLLIAGIASIVIAAVFLFGGAVTDLFDNTCDKVTTGSSSTMNCQAVTP
jgi:pilus assembly protein Flp/PilA